MNLTVTTLGSCRVRTPMRKLVQQGRAQQNIAGVYGYTHYTKEALQILRSMSGELVLPDDLRPFITRQRGRLLHSPRRLNDLRRSDLLVVELSSAKELVFRGYYLQINLTRNRLAAGRPAIARWWRDLYNEPSDFKARMAALASADFTPLEASIVALLRVRRQTPDDIRADMRAIGTMYRGPILFVTHFDTPTPGDGPRVPGRAAFIATTQEVAAELGHRVYDPTADLVAYAGDRPITAAIQDMGHFTDAFIDEVLVDRMAEETQAAVEEASPPRRLQLDRARVARTRAEIARRKAVRDTVARRRAARQLAAVGY